MPSARSRFESDTPRDGISAIMGETAEGFDGFSSFHMMKRLRMPLEESIEMVNDTIRDKQDPLVIDEKENRFDRYTNQMQSPISIFEAVGYSF